MGTAGAAGVTAGTATPAYQITCSRNDCRRYEQNDDQIS